MELILGIPESAVRALSSSGAANSFFISAPSKSGANGAFYAISVNDMPKVLARMKPKSFDHGKFGRSFLAHFEAQNDPHPMAVLSDESAALWLSSLHQNQAWTILYAIPLKHGQKIIASIIEQAHAQLCFVPT